MAVIDISEDTSGSTPVNLIDNSGEESQIKEAGITSAIVATDQGKDPVEAFKNTTAPGDLVGSKIVSGKQTVTDRIAQIEVGLDLKSADQVMSETTDLGEDLSGDRGVLGPYIQQIKSMPSSAGKSEEAIKELAFLSFQREELSQFVPDSIGEGVEDFFGVFIPKRTAEAAVDLAVSMGFIEDDLADKALTFLDPFELFNKMQNVALSLETPEERAKYMKAVSEQLDFATDNNFTKSEIMGFIFTSKGSTDVDEFFDILDLGAVVEAPVIAAKALKGLIKGGSALNTLRKIGSSEGAADIIAKVEQDVELGMRIGASQADIADAVNPLINKEISELYTGVDADEAAAIKHMLDLQDSRFIAATRGQFREGVLDREEADQLMRAAEIKQMEKPGIVDVQLVDKDESGFTMISTEAFFDESGEIVTRSSSKSVDFLVNDQGKMVSDPLDDFGSFLRSDPANRFTGKMKNWFVSTVERMSRSQARTAFNFNKMMSDIIQPLSSKSAAKLDKILKQGSEEGVEYTVQQLKDRFGFSPKESEAYVGYRNVIAHMYSLKNKQLVDTYRAQNIKVVDAFDGVVPAKTADDLEAALSLWNTSSDSRHINVMGGGLKSGNAPINLLRLESKGELTSEMLEEAYAQGYRLARSTSDSGLFKRGDTHTQWALVRAENVINPKGQQLLNKIPGYVPRQRTNGFFFIKSNKTGTLSGAEDFTVGETVAWSDSAKAADDWIASQDDPSKFVKQFDREMSSNQSSQEISNTHGGLYSGARKTEELPFVGNGNEEFADSFKAVQNYINHISKQYPATLYRLGAEKRLISIAEKLGVKGATGPRDVLEKAIASGIKKSSKDYALLSKIRDQVNFVNMVPSSKELEYAERIQDFATALEGGLKSKIPGWDKIPKFFYNRASAKAHPADILKGVTFNHLLGMYNPAQFIVQFSGAMVGFSVAPVQFAKAFPKAMFGWSSLDNLVTDPLAQAKVIKWMNKNGMGEFAEDYALWSKSGYRESVVNGNADFDSVFFKNLPYNANVVQRAVANHTVFYKAGELANTRMAFATALERYKKKNNLKKISSNDEVALEAIGKDAEVLRLSMSKANEASFNKGWSSVPFQFQQVLTKYFSKILPQSMGGTDELTGVEKMRLGSIPAAITGLGGVPLGQSVFIETMSLFGIDETDLTPEQTQLAKFGVMGWMSSEVFKVNVDFSSRMALAGDALERSWEGLTRGKAIWEWLGPTSNVADRYFRNGQFLSKAFDLGIVKNEEIDLNALKFFGNVLKDIAIDIPSLSRNFKQYNGYFLTQNKQFIRDGKYIFDFETMNNRTALFATFGFQPQETIEIYELDRKIKDSRTAASTFGDTDVDVVMRVLNDYVLNPSRSKEEQQLGSLLVNSVFQKYGQLEAFSIIDQIWDKTKKQKDQSSLLFRYMEESVKRQQTGLDFLNTLISRQIQNRRDQP